MNQVTPQDLIDFVSSRSGLQLITQYTKRAFTACATDDGIEYFLPETQALRRFDLQKLQRICERFSQTNSFRPTSYVGLGCDPTYTVTLIQAYLEAQPTEA